MENISQIDKGALIVVTAIIAIITKIINYNHYNDETHIGQ